MRRPGKSCIDRQPRRGDPDDDDAEADGEAQEQRVGTYSGSTVAARCDQVAPVPPLRMLVRTLATGRPTSAAMASGDEEQGIEAWRIMVMAG
jgi:hypothetical protein